MSNAIIIYFGSEFVKRKDLLTLQPQRWLKDAVINLASLQMSFKERKNKLDGYFVAWYLPTWFAQEALGVRVNIPKLAHSYFTRFMYTGHFSACERIHIPLNQDNIHWFLCIVDLHQVGIYILDPLQGPRKMLSRVKLVNRIIKALEDVFIQPEKDACKLRLQEHLVQVLEYAPQQPNGWDCGMYVEKYFELETFAPPLDIHFDVHESCYRLLVDLFFDRHNNLRDEVMQNVMRQT